MRVRERATDKPAIPAPTMATRGGEEVGSGEGEEEEEKEVRG